MRDFTKWLHEDALRDVVFVIGCGFVAFGASQVYRPAGYIIAGLLLIGIVAATTKH
jgi:hypothetical protein